MSRKKKILIIIHLIFTFSFLFWVLVKPYAMEVVSYKSQLALYEMIRQHKEFFENLPTIQQRSIQQGLEMMQDHPSPSFPHKLVHLVLVQTSAFVLSWILLSTVICLLLLFHIEGAARLAWILPLLVLCYGYNLFTKPPIKEEGLFPKESYVVEHYVKKDPSLNQREQLLRGWHLYLVHEWAKEEPSEEAAIFEIQLDKGLFAFNIARLNKIREGKGDEIVLNGFMSPPSLFRLLFYSLWNSVFAWLINRREKILQSIPLSNPN